MVKYSYLIEIETHESLCTKELSAIKKFLSDYQSFKFETDTYYYDINVKDTKVKYLGERY